jgi:hypothetical protein
MKKERKNEGRKKRKIKKERKEKERKKTITPNISNIKY